MLSSTDRDIVDKFLSIVKVGKITVRNGKKKSSLGKKDQYEWVLYKRNEIQDLLSKFYPYLGERRRKKADEVLVLERIRDKIKYCPKGHLKEGDNLFYSNGSPRCRKCNKELQRKYYYERKDATRKRPRL